MNTIPTTFKRLRTPYTVVGGQKIDKKIRQPSLLSIVLLNRGGRLYRNEVFEELEKMGDIEIFSIEGPGVTCDVEVLSRRFPNVKFLMLHQNASRGEQVNIGIEEAHGKCVFVLWDDMRISTASLSSRLIDKIYRQDVLCSVPLLQNQKGETLPCIQVPAFYKRFLRVVPLPPKNDGMNTLFPFDFAGIYNKEKFFLTGGYDYNFKNPYWQKMDFGFRGHMWG
ncbi:MAG: hypothetical protein AB1798_19385, partial [Spirochaetota bacterium]